MTKPELFSIDTVKEALIKANGKVSEAAKKLGVSVPTVYNYIDRYPELKEIRQNAVEALIDLAESALEKKIKRGDTTAIIFTLKTQGKNRGYIERQEITGKDGQPVISLSDLVNAYRQSKENDEGSR